MDQQGFVYIMASRRNGTLYLGVTSDLPKRAYEHRTGVAAGFTQKYDCRLLVWFPAFERLNPDWEDLFPRLAPL